jgi:predicted DNA-binding protein (UPF0251 family)
MSAALQLPMHPIQAVMAATEAIAAGQRMPVAHAALLVPSLRAKPEKPAAEALISYAFYRKHTENLLRRYLYASIQVGRSPSLLGESVGRGWVSSRRVRTFEDAVIFVLDIERCLDKLNSIERQLISRIVLQEYTQTEAASFLGVCVRTVCTKFPQALDRLTEMLVEAELLVLPD